MRKHRTGPRWVLATVGLMLAPTLAGCPDEPAPRGDDAAPSSGPGSEGPGPSTSTAAAASTALAEGGSCGVAWTSLAPCQQDGRVHAMASTRSTPLARSMIAGMVRGALARAIDPTPGTRTLEQVEVPWVIECQGAVFGLGSAKDPGTTLPECTIDLDDEPESVLGDGCPDWTHRVLWSDGDQIFAVGVARGISNRRLGESAAKNRALAELSTHLVAQVEVTDQGSRSQNLEAKSTKDDQFELAECGDALFVKLTRSNPSP